MEEMNTVKQNCIRHIVELPKEKKTVGCKWVFTGKCKTESRFERYKARLVAKGFTQTYGVDCQETFTLVAKAILLEFCCLLQLTLIGLFINWILRMSLFGPLLCLDMMRVLRVST